MMNKEGSDYMSNYSNRIPPVKLVLSKDNFNSFMNFLSEIEKSEDKNISDDAKLIKKKLLKYSIPKIDEKGNSIVDIRFYVNESSIVINQFIQTLEMFNEVDYYSVLEKVREQYKDSNVQN